MVTKKKRTSHQKDPVCIQNGATGDSSESGDENQLTSLGDTCSSCQHVTKSIDLSRVKKSLKANKGIVQQCKECFKSGLKESIFESMGGGELWLCLKCGNQACGRDQGQHAKKHYETPRSECHALVVGTDSWNIWCYGCNQSIAPTCIKKLSECVNFIKKQEKSSPVIQNEHVVSKQVVSDVNHTHINSATIEVAGSETRRTKSSTTIVNNLPRVRGLTNLGNTCFFNALLQCLARTPFLLPMLHEMSSPGKRFRLPGGAIVNTDKSDDLPELEGELNKWGSLTETLAYTLEELQSAKVDCYNPSKLLQKVTQRCPQFAGGDQHDSHELLRHLLEAVRTEDLKRYQTIILHKLGLSEKSNPSQVEDDLRIKAKAYGRQAAEMMMCPEPVFRGVLVSTLECQECFHSSHREESFLDLSLPVIADKPQPPSVRRKSNNNDDEAVEMNSTAAGGQPSKYQLKKERRQAKRNSRQARQKLRNVKNNISQEQPVQENAAENISSESEQSDADVEDNVDQEGDMKTNDVGESGYSSEKQCNDSSVCMTNGDSALSSPCSPVNGTIAKSTLPFQNSVDTPLSSSLTSINVELDDNNNNNADCVVSQENCASPDSSSLCKTTCNGDSLKEDCSNLTDGMNKLSVNSDSTANTCMALIPINSIKTVSTTSNVSPAIAMGWYENDKVDSSPERDTLFTDTTTKSSETFSHSYSEWNGTLSSRYHCEEGDLSLESCLNQFTAIELMTGTNKVGCENCTKQQKRGKEEKTVYTNSTKQLLVSSVPPVLILHLKRFQVQRAMFRKMTRHVSFPLVLDLSPICSVKCKDSSSIDPHQNKILYALYGIVEHSGTLHRGHYVAYVKVRPPVQPDGPQWSFMPSNFGNGVHENGKRMHDEENLPEPPPGKWYYVSDSHVTEVSEDRVLKSQAYLLFYERIW